MKIRPFLMFQGNAEKALDFYVSLLPDSRIADVVRYGPGDHGPDGSFKQAKLFLAGQEVMIFDSPPMHAFTFTPSFSFFIDCDSEQQIDDLASKLGEGGAVMMPLDNYGFSRRYTWLSDRFGVSWQLNLA